jgi:hypothetical protein
MTDQPGLSLGEGNGSPDRVRANSDSTRNQQIDAQTQRCLER